MSANPCRAELQALVAAFDEHGGKWPQENEDALHAAVARARALLDQQEPKGAKPVVDYSRVLEIATEAQIRSAAQYLVKKRNCDGDLIPAIEYAFARWGRPTPQPPVAGEVAELLEWLRSNAQTVQKASGKPANGAKQRLTRAADLLQRQHPQPVPVSERLPGPEDCDAEGRCWLRYTNVCNVTQWSLIFRSAILDGPYTHWLPANALPTPEVMP